MGLTGAVGAATVTFKEAVDSVEVAVEDVRELPRMLCIGKVLVRF